MSGSGSRSERESHREEEFDMLMARNGLEVPPGLRAGVLAGYGELRELAELLRTPRPAGHEPAAVYRVPGEQPRG